MRYSLRGIQARTVFYLKSGFNTQEIQRMARTGGLMSLADIMSKINQRGAELEKQGMKPDMIRQTLEQEFFTMGQ